MTKTAVIEIPQYVQLHRATVQDLLRLMTDVLAGNPDLAIPTDVEVSRSGSARLQFDSEAASSHALAEWADRFGGVVRGDPGIADDGGSYVRCEVRFIHHDTEFEAYAYVTTEAATAT